MLSGKVGRCKRGDRGGGPDGCGGGCEGGLTHFGGSLGGGGCVSVVVVNNKEMSMIVVVQVTGEVL